MNRSVPAGNVLAPKQPIAHIAARTLLFAIEGYRRLISPLLGPHCRFHPTCSGYAKQAIQRYGPLGGSARALARIVRCHPFSRGGYDPLG